VQILKSLKKWTRKKRKRNSSLLSNHILVYL
jgi:hypothetical protein